MRCLKRCPLPIVRCHSAVVREPMSSRTAKVTWPDGKEVNHNLFPVFSHAFLRHAVYLRSAAREAVCL